MNKDIVVRNIRTRMASLSLSVSGIAKDLDIAPPGIHKRFSRMTMLDVQWFSKVLVVPIDDLMDDSPVPCVAAHRPPPGWIGRIKGMLRKKYRYHEVLVVAFDNWVEA